LPNLKEDDNQLTLLDFVGLIGTLFGTFLFEKMSKFKKDGKPNHFV